MLAHPRHQSPQAADQQPRLEGCKFRPQQRQRQITQAGDVIGAAHDDARHPVTRAAMAHALWPSAGTEADRIEAVVVAGRIAAVECGAAVFAPVAMGGVLRAYGAPDARLAAWLEAVEAGCLAAMRHLDGIEAWSARAVEVMAPLSGRTPRALREVLAEWPLVSAPMAEALTGASRAAVQRNLVWMETQGLIREVTGRGRFRMWTAAG